MEVTAFHRNLIRSSLWPYSSPHGGRPLTGILLFGARTFLSQFFITEKRQRLSGQLQKNIIIKLNWEKFFFLRQDLSLYQMYTLKLIAGKLY